jgi:hypothetical protein
MDFPGGAMKKRVLFLVLCGAAALSAGSGFAGKPAASVALPETLGNLRPYGGPVELISGNWKISYNSGGFISVGSRQAGDLPAVSEAGAIVRKTADGFPTHAVEVPQLSSPRTYAGPVILYLGNIKLLLLQGQSVTIGPK